MTAPSRQRPARKAVQTPSGDLCQAIKPTLERWGPSAEGAPQAVPLALPNHTPHPPAEQDVSPSHSGNPGPRQVTGDFTVGSGCPQTPGRAPGGCPGGARGPMASPLCLPTGLCRPVAGWVQSGQGEGSLSPRPAGRSADPWGGTAALRGSASGCRTEARAHCPATPCRAPGSFCGQQGARDLPLLAPGSVTRLPGDSGEGAPQPPRL